MIMHIGNKIKLLLKEQGLSVVDFASLIYCNRKNVYKLFEKEDINTGLLIRISQVLQYDFFAEISTELNIRRSFGDCPLKDDKVSCNIE